MSRTMTGQELDIKGNGPGQFLTQSVIAGRRARYRRRIPRPRRTEVQEGPAHLSRRIVQSELREERRRGDGHFVFEPVELSQRDGGRRNGLGGANSQTGPAIDAQLGDQMALPSFTGCMGRTGPHAVHPPSHLAVSILKPCFSSGMGVQTDPGKDRSPFPDLRLDAKTRRSSSSYWEDPFRTEPHFPHLVGGC